jgi:tRNA-specific 2-thiouridylase
MRVSDAVEPLERAASVARRLGIVHHVVDCRDAFRELVLERCWRDYVSGRTPNPCILCNREIKFGLLFDSARSLGARTLATGHHARLERRLGCETPFLRRGKDAAKDQSYFLALLSPEQLAAARFPVGEMTKAEVRSVALSLSIPSAATPESQDTCIAASLAGREGVFAETLRGIFGETVDGGVFVDLQGRTLGRHHGVHRFTIGQRRGLGISLGRRAYVAALRADRGQVVLTTDPRDLLSSRLHARDALWHVAPPSAPLACHVQIRSRHRAAPARASALDDARVLVDFDEPQEAVTPGQAAVIYDDDRVLGFAWITSAERLDGA